MTRTVQFSSALFLYVMFTNAVTFAIVRHLSADYPTFQLFLCYNLFALLCFIPWLAKHGVRPLRTSRWSLYGMRAGLEFIAFTLSFHALTLLPLPMHTALSFVTPLVGTVIAMIILKERPHLYSWVAILVGFIGMLVITRPDIGGWSPGIAYMLLSATGFCLCGTLIKLLTATERPMTIAFYMIALTTLIALPFGAAVWEMPRAEHWPWLVAMGVIGFSQQIAVARALSGAAYTTLIPLNFAQLVFVSLFAYLFFDEIIQASTLTGAMIILSATLWHAYASSRQQRTPELETPAIVV